MSGKKGKSSISKTWKKEIARDCLALGSIPFYLIVIVRAFVGEFMPFIMQLTIALIILVVLSRIKRLNFDQYVARSLVLVVFTALFYKDILYTIFAFILWIFIIISANYLKENKRAIATGIAAGIIVSVVSYYLAGLVL